VKVAQTPPRQESPELEFHSPSAREIAPGSDSEDEILGAQASDATSGMLTARLYTTSNLSRSSGISTFK
jgi:hypothetical protein